MLSPPAFLGTILTCSLSISWVTSQSILFFPFHLSHLQILVGHNTLSLELFSAIFFDDLIETFTGPTCFLFRVLKFTSPVKMIFPNSGLIYLTTYLISPPLAFSTCHLRHMLQSGTLPSSTNLFLPQFFRFPWKALSNYSGQAGKKSKNLWNHPGLFSFIQNSQQQISKCKSSLLFPSTPFCFHYSSPHLFSSYSILF